MGELPTHRNEHTGNVALDRIQGNVRDLIDYVRGLAWLTRRAYVALSTDVTIASAAYVQLLSTTIATVLTNGFLVVSFTASGVKITNAGTPSFRVVVDGAPVKGLSLAVPLGFQFNAAIVVRAPVTRGTHTVRVDWLTNTASAHINAASVVEEHAAMTVHEEAA